MTKRTISLSAIVVFIGILVYVIISKDMRQSEQSYIRNVRTAISAYHSLNGNWPSEGSLSAMELVGIDDGLLVKDNLVVDLTGSPMKIKWLPDGKCSFAYIRRSNLVMYAEIVQ